MSKTTAFLILFTLISTISGQGFLSKNQKLDSTDIFKCLSDLQSFQADITSFINQIKAQGVSIQVIISELENLQPKIQALLSDCGININLTQIEEELKSEKREISLDPTQCLSDVGVLVQAGEVLINDVQHKNFLALIGDLKTFVNSFKSALHDCLNTPKTETSEPLANNQDVTEVYVEEFNGFVNCISDIKNKIVPDITHFIEIAKTKDIVQIVSALVAIQADLKLTLTDCGLSQTHIEAHLLTFNPLECLVDVSQLVTLGETIVSNFQNRAFETLIQNVYQLVNLVPKVISECTSFNSTMNLQAHELQLSTDIFKCIADVQEEVNEVKGLIASIQSGLNISDVIPRIQHLIAGLDSLEKDCGITNKATQFSFDPEHCIADISNTVAAVTNLLNDYNAGNIAKLIQDVSGLIQEVRALSADCLSQNLTNFVEIGKDKFDPVVCLNYGYDIFTTVQQVIADYKNQSYPQLLSDVVHLAGDIEAFASECLNLNITQTLKFDPQECLRDVLVLSDNVEVLVGDLKAGNYSRLIQDVAVVLQNVQGISADCLSTQLSFNTNLQFNPASCIHDITLLVPLFNQTISDIKSGNFIKVVQDIAQFNQLVVNVKTDCLSSSSSALNIVADPNSCAQDVFGLVGNAEAILVDVETRNYGHLVDDVQSFVHYVNLALSDCLSSPQLSFNINLQFNPASCIHDITLLVPLFNQTISDIKSGNFIKVVQDIAQFNQLVVNVKTDCLSSSSSALNIVADPNSCAQDVFGLVGNAESILVDVETRNYGHLVDDVQSFVHYANLALSDCLSSKFTLSTTEFENRINLNPTQCLNDVLALVPNLQSIVGDVQSKNYEKLLEDVIQVVPLLKSFAGDCLSYNVSSVDSCIADAKTFALEGIELIKKLQNNTRDISSLLDIMARINQLKKDGEKVSQTCKVDLTLEDTFEEILKQNNTGTLLGASNEGSGNSCALDVFGLAGLGERILVDAATRNYGQLIDDIQAFAQKTKIALSDCLSFKSAPPAKELENQISPTQIELIGEDRNIPSPF